MLVQMRHEGDGEKGPRLTMNLAVSGRYLVYHPLGSDVSSTWAGAIPSAASVTHLVPEPNLLGVLIAGLPACLARRRRGRRTHDEATA